MLMQPVTCGPDGSTSRGDEDLQRFLICAVNVTWQPSTTGGDFGEPGAGPETTIVADPITCLICLPSYSITTGEATLIGQNVTSVVVSANAESRQVSGLTPWQQGMSVFQALGRTPPPNFLNTTDPLLGTGNENFYSLLQSIDPNVATSRRFSTLLSYRMCRERHSRRLAHRSHSSTSCHRQMIPWSRLVIKLSRPGSASSELFS